MAGGRAVPPAFSEAAGGVFQGQDAGKCSGGSEAAPSLRGALVGGEHPAWGCEVSFGVSAWRGPLPAFLWELFQPMFCTPGPALMGSRAGCSSAPGARTAVPMSFRTRLASPLCQLSSPRSWVFPGLLQPLGARGCPPSKAQQGTIPVTAEDPFLLLPWRCRGVPVPTVSPLPRWPCCHGVPVPMAPVSGRGCFCAAGGNKAGSVSWPRSSAVPGRGGGRGEQLGDPKSFRSRGLTRVLHWEGEFICPLSPGAQGVGALHSHPWMGDSEGEVPGDPRGGGDLAGTFPHGRRPAAPSSSLPVSPRQ